ncbi:hypothetical protein MCRH_0696 [Moraxella catarrhalis RH4]|nr:hypothetical protein MCRH_0696 [Moraxella catarrhalis RH4]
MHKLSDDSVGNKISHNSQLRLILLSGLDYLLQTITQLIFDEWVF